MTNETTDARYDALVLEAQKLGREAGQNAAAWWAQSTIGWRTSDERLRAAARLMLEAYNDGDDGDYRCDPDGDGYDLGDWPEAPSLSGEWADSMTPQRLYSELGCDPFGADDGHDLGICRAWEDAASEAFTDAILEYLKSAATA